ncbi:hypothetical protein [Polynucleobacter antarcticus]|uniref:Uncharacterized protein n=1 Tax=Polynucleobacter antarcticus TaxID=1743162 RepID=A0A6M9PRT2_9BURK|nr:hypothetical protein [Polynucleobacter antarcticus]QKM62582.1 hypothetical protein DCO16_05570 [Polynucleobacter antarcticus]
MQQLNISSNTLNRSQRRRSEKNIQRLSTKGSPREKLSLTTLRTLQNKIESYGNTLSDEHKQALLEVTDLYSRIVFKEVSGRFVVALDCGLGKTLSVVALASAIHQLGLDSKSIMICQSKISELCLMVDALLEAGVPPQKIGLVHSYTYAPSSPILDGEVINMDGSVRKGYAAKPSNAKEDSTQFQFLLVSHSKVKGKREIVKHTQFKGKPRTLTIWDESFISTEATSIGLRDLKTAIQEFENTQFNNPEVDHYISWLKRSYDLLIKEENAQKQGTPVSVLTLPYLSDIEATKFEGLSKYNQKDKRYEWRQMLRDLLKMSSDPVRVSLAGGEAVLQFNDSISKELTNLVVLDASYRIRELVKVDPTLTEPKFFVHRHNLKSYEDVVLHRMNYYGSRLSAENSVKSPKIAKEIALVIKEIPLNEAVCLFTFKWTDKRKLHHAQVIKDALESEGINLSSQVTLRDGSVKPRFIFKTWGQETGSNNASYCSHLFMAGVLRQQENSFLAQLVGQSQDILRDIDQSLLNQAMVSEFAHLVYQAGLRSQARIVSKGKALPAHLYLVLDEPRIEEPLREIMRGLQVVEWIPQDTSLMKREAIEGIAKVIRDGFTQLNLGSLTQISVRAFKQTYGLTEMPEKTFQVSRDQVLKTNLGWILPAGSRSFKKVFQDET